MGTPADEIVVATFNTHAGVDGWGRAFDVVAACRALDADVLVLQEVWAPDHGTAMADELAETLGSSVAWYPMARGRRGRPDPRATGSWLRTGGFVSGGDSIYLGSERPLSRRTLRSARYREANPGTIGLAVLSRRPVARQRTLELGRLRRDNVRRGVLLLDVEVGGTTLTVCGTHMSHLTYGSPLQFRRLRGDLAREVGDGPAVLAGDMNLWGPPTVALLRLAARRRSRTWPAWRPHSQLDHILLRHVSAVGADVLGDFGSDHRAVRVRLRVA